MSYYKSDTQNVIPCQHFSGEDIFAKQIAQMFDVVRRKTGFKADSQELSTAAFRRADKAQLSLF